MAGAESSSSGSRSSRSPRSPVGSLRARVPDRSARGAGRRRSTHEPGVAFHHRRHLPAEAARDGDRDLGRGVGDRACDRPARRRADRREPELELDLLHQRPRRHPRDRRLAVRDPGVSRHLRRAEHRPARTDHLERLPVLAQLRADRGEPPRLERRPRSWVCSPLRPCCSSPSSCSRASAAADARSLALPDRLVHRRERRGDARLARDVRRLLLRLALHPEHPRLLADAGGRGFLPM